MADPRDDAFRAYAEAAIAQQKATIAQQLQREGMLLTWDNITWRGGFGEPIIEAPPPPRPVTGEIMIELFPMVENIPPTERTYVKDWLENTAKGKKATWPGFPLCLRVNGKGRYVHDGIWECREGDKTLYVGNGTGMKPPLWAPSSMMAICRYYHLDDDRDLVKAIHSMLATLVADEVIPVMTEIAEDFHGNPIIEIAVHKKERILVGKFPGTETFRLLSGEIVEINDKDWVRLKM